ncbi:MAG: DUF2169 domain-containing protein [Patiriisocius sp.]|uniref:DUF2169 domain-containing protein n=1 Tax=Patiriisocius sp. TaxID=2822396 RepID=UPI003EF5E058
MEFYNETPFSSLTHRTTLGEENIAMSVQCRVFFDVDADGNATISDLQKWELKEDYWESEFGPMDKDNVYVRGGVDVLVFGHARAPKGQTITQTDVAVYINDKKIHAVKVFGNRTWKSILGLLSISAAEPFTSIPLTLENAFGGTTTWDGLELPYPANPYGKGYYFKKENALGNPLPNIEDIDDPITKWKSWKDPAGLCSCPILPLKAKHHLELEENNRKIKKVKDSFFNSSFPQMIVDRINPGNTVKVTNVTDRGPFFCKIPKLELEIEIKIGEAHKKRSMNIEQVGLLPDTKQIFITYNFPFKYTVVPLEKRKTMLRILEN